VEEFEGRDFLATAIFLATQTDDEGSQRSAISRAYYACFHRARDYARTHSAIIRQDGSAHSAVRRSPEMRDPETAFELKRLHTFRKHADYDFPFPNGDPTDEAQSAIDRASRIIAAIDALEVEEAEEHEVEPDTQEE
jgi:uncharacterized protein (UPF0332 family)